MPPILADSVTDPNTAAAMVEDHQASGHLMFGSRWYVMPGVADCVPAGPG
jgi:hypothetical protein